MVNTGYVLEQYPKWHHNLTMIEVVSELMDRGFTCYLEQEIPKDENHNVSVDIYAVKDERELIMEIGYLSQLCKGERMRLLRTLKPDADIVHITTLANWVRINGWMSLYR